MVGIHNQIYSLLFHWAKQTNGCCWMKKIALQIKNIFTILGIFIPLFIKFNSNVFKQISTQYVRNVLLLPCPNAGALPLLFLMQSPCRSQTIILETTITKTLAGRLFRLQARVYIRWLEKFQKFLLGGVELIISISTVLETAKTPINLAPTDGKAIC